MKIREKMKELVGCGKTCHTQNDFDSTQYADPLFGVGSATSAGPTMPSGSIHPSPETLEKDNGGYTRNHPIIGFGHAYISGSGGVKCYGNYLLAPMVGGVELESERRASFAVKGSERAKCYEYCTELENGIKTRVAPAHDAAIHIFDFPDGCDSSFLVDVARKLDIDAAMKSGGVTVEPAKRRIYGGGTYFGNWNPADWDMFFALEFDSDFEEIGVFKGEALIPADKSMTVTINEPQRLGAYVKLGTDAGEVRVKLAISFVSAERAVEYLEGQINGFDYDGVVIAGRERWKETLGVIRIESDDKALLRRFYTAMYHMNIQPRDRTHDSGKWDDFHTVWDSWKTVFPMYSLLYPQKMGALVDSFIERAFENESAGNGIVISDEYVAAKEFLAGQGGNDIDNAIADAYLKGIKLTRYDWEDAYKVLLDSAEKMRSPEYVERGFATNNAVTVTGRPYSRRFRPAGATKGFAFNDKAVAAVARELGTAEEYEKYEKRSANWLNAWNKDAESEGFYGFPQNPRDDGSFEKGFDAHGGYNTHYYENTGWDASYMNFNDMPRLVKAMGGAEKFTERLLFACEHSVNYFNDDHGKEGYLNFTNEPSFQIPWLFCTDEIKRPDLAAKVIDGVIKRFSLENDYPGDEDNGGMSSYYVFLMCGFFPYSTTENYYLHGTRLNKITFRLGNGREFIVSGENVGGDNIYVESALWQGNELNVCKLTHSQILEGGELHFVMCDKPTKWAHKQGI